MSRAVHLIPFDAIGGVERAARTIENGKYDNIDYQVETIFPPTVASKRSSLWNPWYYLKSIVSYAIHPPDLLIVSLWRAYIVGFFLKVLRPKVKLVTFLHLPNDVHIIDRLFTRMAANRSTSVWADSCQTMQSRLPSSYLSNSKVISFVTEHVASQENHSILSPKPVFIFWGRIHPQKGLNRAIRLFARIYEHLPEARYIIIGPDDGEQDRLASLIEGLNLTHAISFMGAMNFEKIKKESRAASFYLQMSELEGMAMSVVEAMQLGLVPVVTPVGEIEYYCIDGQNAIVISEDQKAVLDISELLTSPSRYNTMRSNVMNTWSNTPLYKDDVLQACREILSPCAV